MPNLNEITYYADPVDAWAARREFDLRERRWWRHRLGTGGEIAVAFRSLLPAATEAAEAFRAFGRAWSGVPDEWARELEELRAS